MIEPNSLLNITGRWNIAVDTPFGKEQYLLSLNNVDGKLYGLVSHEKGIVPLTNIYIVDRTFKCSLDVEFPIKATVNIQANIIDDNKMFGTLLIDEYLETLFVGVKQ